MTQLETTELGTLEEPVPIPSLPFAQTIDVSGRTARPDEPSPCLPSAASVWYALPPGLIGALVVDLTGSTPPDPVVRVYRVAGPTLRVADVPRLREPRLERTARARGPRCGGRHRARPGRHVGVARRAPRRARRGARLTRADAVTSDPVGAWTIGYYENCLFDDGVYSGPVTADVTATDAQGAQPRLRSTAPVRRRRGSVRSGARGGRPRPGRSSRRGR